MEDSYKKIFCKIIRQMGINSVICEAVRLICIEWSDLTSDKILDTYEYVKLQKPNEMKDFMCALAHTVQHVEAN